MVTFARSGKAPSCRGSVSTNAQTAALLIGLDSACDDDAIVVVDSNEVGRMAQITINEGLAWLKTLKKRHDELLALRNDNAHRERRFYGASADKEIVKEPVYDVKILDRLVTA